LIKGIHQLAARLRSSPVTLLYRGTSSQVVSVPAEIERLLDPCLDVEALVWLTQQDENAAFAGLKPLEPPSRILRRGLADWRAAVNRAVLEGSFGDDTFQRHAPAYRQAGRSLRPWAKHWADCYGDGLGPRFQVSRDFRITDIEPFVHALNALETMFNALARLDHTSYDRRDRFGAFCAVCYRHIDADGTQSVPDTCSLHRHDERRQPRQAYMKALRLRPRFMAGLRARHERGYQAVKQALDSERHPILLEADPPAAERQPDGATWCRHFAESLRHDLPYAADRIEQAKGPLSACQQLSEVVRHILRGLNDGLSPRVILEGTEAPVNAHAAARPPRPRPEELLSLLVRADAWFEAEAGSRRLIEQETLRALHNEGLSPAAIAERLGVSRQAVQRACQRWGLPTRPRGRPVNPNAADEAS
jgi:hypothetical protein